MSTSLLQKLVDEVRKFQNKDFLKASMAVCALAASADAEVSLAERYSIDKAIAETEALQIFDTAKCIEILDDYLYAIETEGQAAKDILYNKVQRMRSNAKQARTLMRVAYLIITADREIGDGEMGEFTRLCEVLNLNAPTIWENLRAEAH